MFGLVELHKSGVGIARTEEVGGRSGQNWPEGTGRRSAAIESPMIALAMRLHSILAPKQKRVVEKGLVLGWGWAGIFKHQAFPDHPRPPPVLKRASVQPRPGQETSTADLTYGYSTVCQKCAGAGAGAVLMECRTRDPPLSGSTPLASVEHGRERRDSAAAAEKGPWRKP